MDQKRFEDTRQPEFEPDPAHSSGEALQAGTGKTRGIDLAGVLGGLLGNIGGADPSASQSEAGLSGLLGALMSGDHATSLDSLAASSGLSQSAIAAVAPLIAGFLTGEGHEAGVTRAALDDLAQGRPGAADALAGTGLLKEIMRRTGLSQAGALGIIAAVLKALGLGKTSAHSKPKPKPKPSTSTAAKPKPKPSAGTAAKPKPKPGTSTAAKPKPKPSAGTAAKPKPKPGTSTAAKPKPGTSTAAKPKPSTTARPKPSTTAKPKPGAGTAAKPKRSGEVGEGPAEEPAA